MPLHQSSQNDTTSQTEQTDPSLYVCPHCEEETEFYITVGMAAWKSYYITLSTEDEPGIVDDGYWGEEEISGDVDISDVCCSQCYRSITRRNAPELYDLLTDHMWDNE